MKVQNSNLNRNRDIGIGKCVSLREWKLKPLKLKSIPLPNTLLTHFSISLIYCLPTNQAQPKIVFPKIAIKSSDGPVIVREREKILDEKIVRRTEEVACPITGDLNCAPSSIEKIIETEVRASKSNSNQQLLYYISIGTNLSFVWALLWVA